MNYFILRNGQQYGPYSQANLQVYLSIGNITLNDLGRTDGINEWLPLAQIMESPAPAPPPISAAGPGAVYNGFNSLPPTPTTPNGNLCGGYNVQQMPPSDPTQGCSGYPGPPGMNAISAAPLPPGGLHWAVLLLLVAVTLGIFGWIWSFIQANWVKKIDRENKAILYFVIYVVSWVAGQALNIAREPLLALPAFLVALVFVLMGLFSMRASMQRYYNTVEPRGLRLSGVMTFFFGIIYLQYHLNRIVQEKRTPQLAQTPPPYQYARPA
jgi:hypothetical protein